MAAAIGKSGSRADKGKQSFSKEEYQMLVDFEDVREVFVHLILISKTTGSSFSRKPVGRA